MILKYGISKPCLMIDEAPDWRTYEGLWRKLTFSMGTESTDCVFLSTCSANGGSSLHRLDPQNVDHLFMRFYVEGENGKATVRLEMTKVHPAMPKLTSGRA